MALRQRAKTASPIRVSGMPRSSELTLVHFPVPFCPASVQDLVDYILAVLVLVARISRVISIR